MVSHFLLVVLVASILHVSYATTAYNVLEKNNLPRGLLPNGVKSYILKPDGKIEATLPRESLPENGILPCARIFAVCIISGTRRRPPLPCVARRTHGKEKTHGKPYSSPCAKGQHTANLDLRRVSASRHTANMDHVRGTPFFRQGASRPLLFAVCQG